MSISEWRNRCCFVWTIERPVANRARYSPKFSVKDTEFYLEYSIWQSNYRIRMVPAAGNHTFNVTIHVEGQLRCALPLYSFREYYYDTTNHCGTVHWSYVWNYPESEILKSVPDFLTNGLMTFLFTIDLEKPCYKFTPQPPIKITIEKEDKSLQKDFQGEEKCSQTPAYISDTSCLESLSEDFSKLLLDPNFHSDMELTCGDRSFKVHKNILSTRSKVFAAMLRNDMAESNTGTIQVRDMDPAIFGCFLRYLYTGKLPELTVETAKSLYEVADKYAVAGLMKRCAHFLDENLDPGNACELLILADAHSDGEFKSRVMDYILEKEIQLMDDVWLPFCECQPKLGVEVLNYFLKSRRK